MSIIATAVKHLLAAGVTGDALVQAIADMEANTPVAAPAGPSKGALRTRLYRERHKASQSVTCDASDEKASQNVTEPAPSPPPLLSPQTPQTTPPPLPHPARSDARTRGLILEIVLGVIIGHCRASLSTLDRPKRRWPSDMPPPPGVSDDEWAGYVAHRVAQRKSLTPRAYDLLVGKLAKLSTDLWPPGLIVDTMVERGWTSFETAWLNKISENGNGTRTHHDRPGGRFRDPLLNHYAGRNDTELD